ncbi:MAG: response regulator transcription factor [Ignavibacteriales bacterium]|nr:response regulator transcription factor [Ignavibacteriales bacterium]
MEPIKVLIADDHKDFRRVVHDFLSKLPNISVVGEAIDGFDVIEKMERLDPDIVLMDIAMPHRNGLDATRIIKQRWPGKKVLIATMNDNPMYRLQAQLVNADGFILKSSLKPTLEATFRNGGQMTVPMPPLHLKRR